MNKDTQRALILRLLRYGPVSHRDLIFKHGVTQAPARVLELRAQGYRIVTDRGRTLPDGSREMCRYRLVEEVAA